MPSIDRVAFEVFGIAIYWYAIIIVVGMILGVMVAMLLTKRRGFKTDDIMDILLFTIPIAIIGARLYYVVFAWDDSWTFMDIFQTRDGGLAIYGAVLAGIITAYFVCRYKKFTWRQILQIIDCLVVGLILGQAIGRWGNFINQEAFGNLITNTSLMFFPYGVFVNGSWYQATFFYESMWNFVGFAALLYFTLKYTKITGISTCAYFIFYGIGRFFIEGLRSDSLYFLKDLLGEVIRVSQVLSLLLIALGVVGIFLIFKYKQYLMGDSDKLAKVDCSGECSCCGSSCGVSNDTTAETISTIETTETTDATDTTETVETVEAENTTEEK